ncbi:CopG family transcriptional regulator [uncultured Parasphingorhabdus sp.]|uniref:CopG family transcriptional regulator n=1 Tax=uncultured Parasphingorhabdus sp. TaxID=2709694 RepID=UPI0030DC57D8|tara:strand:- start:1894 stop:2307 length:414 start_codon:yes stop_codon:yes gene_type:complete
MRKQSVRYQLFLPKSLAEQFEALAAGPGVTKSAILTDALTAWLSRRAASEAEERFAIRLNTISNQLGRIERDGHVLIEAFALFVHYQLTICPPLAEDDRAARAIGRDRFHAFVGEVGKAMATGKRSLARTDDTGGTS